jgi:hypothetical protein
MSESLEHQHKSSLRLYIEASGKFTPNQVDFLWQQMEQNKNLYNRAMEIYGVSFKDSKGAEIMIEKLRDDLDLIKNG